MRISDWSSDVCSSDLRAGFRDLEVVGRDLHPLPLQLRHLVAEVPGVQHDAVADHRQRAAHDAGGEQRELVDLLPHDQRVTGIMAALEAGDDVGALRQPVDDLALALVARSEEHTSELQSIMRISYAVFCLKK